jgi:hypothetical protein
VKLSTPLPRSVVRQLPKLAALAGELAEALGALKVRGMPERIDPAASSILRDKCTDDARHVPGAIRTLRNRAHSCFVRAERETDPERRAEHEARAVMFRGRADCLEHGRPIPLEWQTPSERLEAAVRGFAAAGLALAEELADGEVGPEGFEPADAFEGNFGPELLEDLSADSADTLPAPALHVVELKDDACPEPGASR